MAENETVATLVDMMDMAQLRDEVRRLSHALTNVDKTRVERRGAPMIGGSDVCATCAAHCNVMDENEAEIARLNAELEAEKRTSAGLVSMLNDESRRRFEENNK